MKKKLMAIIAIIIAFVMSFALVACNNSDNTTPGNQTTPGGTTPGGTTPGGTTPGGTTPGGDGPIDKTGAAKKAVSAVKNLSSAAGSGGSVEINISSEGENPLVLVGSFEKSGDLVKLVDGEDESILNLSTGYIYSIENGVAVYYDAALPSGLYDYIVGMIENSVSDEQIPADVWTQADAVIEYDAETNTVSYKADLAEKINDATSILYDAYSKDKNVTWLIDEYLLYMTNGALQFSRPQIGQVGTGSIIDAVTAFALVFPDYTVGSLLETFANEFGVDIEAMLAENGIDVVELLGNFGIETTEAALKARTIEDVVVGAYKALVQAMTPVEPDVPNTQADESQPGIEEVPSAGIGEALMQYLPIILDGAVNGVKEAGDPSAAEIADGLFTELLGVTDAAKVKALIDELAPTAPELAAAIKANVQIEECSLEVSVTLDADDSVESMGFAVKFAHDYDGETDESFTVLADNNYSFTCKFDITDISDDPDPITFTYGDMSALDHFNVNDAIIVGDTVTEDVRIFVELGGRQNLEGYTVAAGACEYVWSEYVGDYVPSLAANDNIAYDKTTSTVTIKAAYLAEYFATAEDSVFELCMTVEYPAPDYLDTHTVVRTITLNVILLPEDIASL